jgi:hypothetical protein
MLIKSLVATAALTLISLDSFAEQYCGRVNGVDYYNGIAGRTCADLMKDMKLSKEHIDTARKGQQIESISGSDSTTRAIQGIGDYLQQRSDEKEAAEQQEKAHADRQEAVLRQQKIERLAQNMYIATPVDKINKLSCKNTDRGFGIIENKPVFESPEANKFMEKMQLDAINIPQLQEEVNRKGKVKALEQLKGILLVADSKMNASFNEAIMHKDENSIETAHTGYSNFNCNINYNISICRYIMYRWASVATRTTIGVIEKCSI